MLILIININISIDNINKIDYQFNNVILFSGLTENCGLVLNSNRFMA